MTLLHKIQEIKYFSNVFFLSNSYHAFIQKHRLLFCSPYVVKWSNSKYSYNTNILTTLLLSSSKNQMCYLFNKDMFPLCEESIILIEIWPWEDIAYSRTAQILFILNISLYLFHHYLMVLSFVSGQHYKIWHLGNKCVNSVWQCRCVIYWVLIKEHKKK